MTAAANSTIDQTQFPVLPPSVVHYFQQRSYTKCYAAFYSTKSDEVLLGVVTKALKQALRTDSCGDMLYYTKSHVVSPELQVHFINGAQTVVSREASRPMEGSYLMFATPLAPDTTNSESEAFAAIENCAALASLFHGEFVATERHFAALYDLDNGEVAVNSPGIYVRQTADKEHLNQEIARIIDETADLKLAQKPIALTLIRRAHHERDSSVKFMFLWMALEAALGDGKDRRRFALETMSSDYLNEVINNLRSKRSNMVHDGALVSFDLHEFLRIKCVILMGLSGNCELRRRLLTFMENSLQNH